MTVTTRSVSPQKTSSSKRRTTPSPARSTKSTKSSTAPSPKPEQHPSDGEGRERPVRKKFEKTSIAGPDELAALDAGSLSEPVATETDNTAIDASSTHDDVDSAQENATRGRVRRKRSFEELGESHDDTRGDSISKHRKRSPDIDGERTFDDEDGSRRVSLESKTRAEKESLSDYEIIDKPDDTDLEIEATDRPTTPPIETRYFSNGSLEAQLSPQNKRSRDQFVEGQGEYSTAVTQDEETSPKAEKDLKSRPSSMIQTQEDEERKTKRHRDSPPRPKGGTDEGAEKATLANGFGDLSEKSPFGAIAGGSSIFGSGVPKSPPTGQSHTSPTAFAASGFASLAGSAQSPFGNLSPPQSNSETSKDTKPALGFSSGGSSLLSDPAQPSPFGSQSGFGKLGSGFGSAFGLGSTSAFASSSSAPLKSFSSGGGTFGSTAGNKSTKTFGAPPDDEEEEGEVEDDENDTNAAEDKVEEQDERFYEQEVETGEENETTIFSNRAKLYASIDKQWKERGVGVFKINATNLFNDEEEGSDGVAGQKASARFIMRADGSHRVVLNSPLTKQIKIEDPTGGRPKGRTAVFLGFIDEKPVMLQIKMRGVQQTEELYDAVVDVQKRL